LIYQGKTIFILKDCL